MSSPTEKPNAAPDRQAAVVLACKDLTANIEFFVEQLGFRLERISPADEPTIAIVVGHGLRVSLERSAVDFPIRLRMGANGRSLVAPNGTRIDPESPPHTPPSLSTDWDPLPTQASQTPWQEGRAGMRYRDLIPGRLGGRCIASRIRIEDGGAVPDYVHHHAVLFQLIYCAEGWVRVVYEDQGEPFVLNAGDCVLQPPGIRHRVLESSAGLEVVELASPARHDTFVDHVLRLPNSKHVGKSYRGQRFVHHVASRAKWETGASLARTRDLGLAPATDGLVQAFVHHIPSTAKEIPLRGLAGDVTGAYRFLHVLAGKGAIIGIGSTPIELERGDSVTLPGAIDGIWHAGHDAELLHIDANEAAGVTT